MVIGAVLIHGARAPVVIRREQLALMKPGAVLVDVSIDQYVLHLAGAGVARAARENPGPARGVNVAGGKVRDEPVAEATGQPHTELFEALGERAAA